MKNVKMILTNRFDPDVRVYKEAKHLIERGYQVEILCWDRENEYIDKEHDEIDGINIKRFFPYAEYGTGTKQLKAFFQFIKECKAYLRKKNYKYIHCHDLDGIITGYLIKKRKNGLIFDMHEFYEAQGSNKMKNYIIRTIVTYLQNKSKFILYVNNEQTKVMSNRNKMKSIYLPNYPESNNYCDKKSISKNLRISYIGAVRQYNELKNLMDASKDFEGVEVNIHGAGVAYKKLYDIRNNYPNVNITGVFKYSDIDNLYKDTDILYAIYPLNSIQNKTSYPVKFFEAIITKTPIIVDKGTVIGKFVLEKNIGFVIDENNVNELKQLIINIDNNRDILKEKISNIEKIQYDFTWEKVVKSLNIIYP